MNNVGSVPAAATETAEERKRKRLEAWRRKQQQQQQQPPEEPPKPKIQLSLNLARTSVGGTKDGKSSSKKKKREGHKRSNALLEEEEDTDKGSNVKASEEGAEWDSQGRRKRPLDLLLPTPKEAFDAENSSTKRATRASRWDNAGPVTAPVVKAGTTTEPTEESQTQKEEDALDQFMNELQFGGLGQINDPGAVSIQTGGTMMRSPEAAEAAATTTSQSVAAVKVITAEDLELLRAAKRRRKHKTVRDDKEDDDGHENKMEVDDEDQDNKDHHNEKPLYDPKDWLSDAASGTDTDDEYEEEARRKLIEALKAAPAPPPAVSVLTEETLTITTTQQQQEELEDVHHVAQLAAEVRSEKSRREERLRELELAALQARQSAEAAAEPELGRLYNDVETGVMEEAERYLTAAMAAPDALTVLAELNKKKELKAVDHSQIEYLPFVKNLYRVPRSLAHLTHDEVVNRRAKLKVRVRGHGAPAPVSTFEECGFSEKILQILQKLNCQEPFPVQAQCIPTILAGRDVIGIAKTGSGKTLAYLLPMLRHILVQPPLAPNESGPIGMILAPARELAFQIHSVAKQFAKQLNLKSTAVYGGAGVAEQIADLKRGTHIVVATPGRLIDILTMQSGKILSLQRVTYVVMDEADRMYDMGFAPQISAILAAVRPDRQTVLFSATFPKAVETLAKKSLKYPVEVVVGGRSIASDNITQYAELVEEEDKFLRLLQLLGEQVEGTKKVIVFVDTQVRADSIFEQLLRNGYPSLSLHGGKEQEDRDSTLSDFKRKDGPNVLVATGVAGRGLDVPACTCVINYSAPNHLEAYVHQVGRTGRAGNKGVAYTFVSSTEEAKYAPIVVRALSESGQSENISPELKELSEEFKAKVEKGEAKYASSGFKGKGYSYDSTEMNEAQRMARMEKRQALIEAGLLDPDDEDPLLAMDSDNRKRNDGEAAMNSKDANKSKKQAEPQLEIPENLTPELLALPGMKEALLRKAGIVPADSTNKGDDDPSLGHAVRMGDNHWLQEFEINDYPREARWKVTQKETTSRLQDEFRTAVTLKGSHFPPGKSPGEGERRLYLHLEATSERILQNCVLEIQRLLNEETLRVGAKVASGSGSHKYNVLGK